MRKTINEIFFTAWPLSVIGGFLVILIDFVLILLNPIPIKITTAIVYACRSGVLIVPLFATLVLVISILFKALDSVKPALISPRLRVAILVWAVTSSLLSFYLFDRIYNKFAAIIAVQILAGIVAFVVAITFYFFVRSSERLQQLAPVVKKISVIATVVLVIATALSILGASEGMTARSSDYTAGRDARPNILLIVLDTVRADHLSLYGYQFKTSPFLEQMAKESAVFKNAIAASPWTLPSHASIFTGLYPSQHNAHAEHLWLDDSYQTLAETLLDAGYQTVSFSNNDYISSHHNMVQGFERSWVKGFWDDEVMVQAQSLAGSITSSFSWLWRTMQIHILAKISENPASIWDSPTAAVTNQALSDWFRNERNPSKPFFVFVNYMDAHFPYNPDDDTARLFLDDIQLKTSYKLELRFPPIEYLLDISKGRYSESDIQIITKLYDACIWYLDSQLAHLFQKLEKLGVLDETLIIITSDHGEYLGTRNRLAHGLGLHQEVLHVPLLVRYPPLFKTGSNYDTVVTHVDIPATILSAAQINKRSNNMPESQLLFDIDDGSRTNVFAEFRFPLHLLITADLREDNAKYFMEQKTIRTQTHQLIWKSRGTPEFYDFIDDPLQVNDIYSNKDVIAQIMQKQLNHWRKSLAILGKSKQEVPAISDKERLELIDRLRALGYTK